MNAIGSRGALLALLLALAHSPTPAQVARSESGSTPDRYGYTLVDHGDADCAFDFVDIRTSGAAVAFSAASAAAADDDGGAVVALSEPFEFYGASVPGLVMSSNGYLAAAASLGAEDGGDFSNDAGLPALPDNAAGVAARLLVFHDELSGAGSGGSAQSEYFAACPRPSEARGGEDCTVLQWSDWAPLAGGDRFDLQAVLYHRSFQIVFQLRPGAGGMSGGTIGIQDHRATGATQYLKASAGLLEDTAVCLFDPRFPAGGPVADLELTNNNKVDELAEGETVTYAVAVLNRGPSPLSGATVADAIPPGLTGCNWTCEASVDSTCSAAGSDGIDDLVDLAAAGWVDYRQTCLVADPALVAYAAGVTVPAGVIDPEPGNNGATDDDSIENLPPDCSTARPDRTWLWPPNHQLVPVRILGVSDPEHGAIALSVDGVAQDEPVRAVGSGNSAPDCEIRSDGGVRLRAERGGFLNGRVYRIRFTATDAGGASCNGVVSVAVPLDASTPDAVDDGPLYDACIAPAGRPTFQRRELRLRATRGETGP